MSESILDASRGERYDVAQMASDNRVIETTLPRLVRMEGNIDGLLLLRARIGRLQLAGLTVTGARFLETQIGEGEFQGVTFRYCQFKKTRFERLALRHVTFEHCTFEEVSLTPVMEPSAIDGVNFVRCEVYDPEQKLIPLLRGKQWRFEDCVLLAPAGQEEDGSNTFLSLLAFTPAAVAAPVEAPRPGPAPKAEVAAPQPASKEPKPEPKTKGGSRFDQLEIA